MTENLPARGLQPTDLKTELTRPHSPTCDIHTPLVRTCTCGVTNHGGEPDEMKIQAIDTARPGERSEHVIRIEMPTAFGGFSLEISSPAEDLIEQFPKELEAPKKQIEHERRERKSDA